MAHELNLSPPPRLVTAAYVFLWLTWVGILFGPLSFLGVLQLVFSQRSDPLVEIQPILTFVWLMWVIFGIGGATAGRALFLRRMQRQRPGNIVWAYLLSTLVWWFLIEGAAFFGLTLCIIHGAFTWHAGLAVALLGLIALSFPRRRMASKAVDNGGR